MARLTRDDWITGAFELLATGGVNDVRVEPLARRLGVTKGSFYHHFADRQALLDAVLLAWVRIDTDRIIELVAAATQPVGDPIASLRQLAELTIGTRTDFDGVETAIREWAGSDEAAALRCSAVDSRRLAYVRNLLIDAGVDEATADGRSQVFYRVIIGEYTWRRYGGIPIDSAPVHDLVDWLAAT